MAFRSNSARILRLVREASIEALEETAALAVADAHPNTPIQYGAARGSLRFQAAQEGARGPYVDWGSFGIEYYIYLELGTSRREGGHMLRDAADHEYPELAGRIKRRLRGKLG